jgi:hypothetical protein
MVVPMFFGCVSRKNKTQEFINGFVLLAKATKWRYYMPSRCGLKLNREEREQKV